MNAKKSADYCNLIENVKNKYRKNPIYAKKTPHIKYMLIGQDFGPSEKEEIKGTIANVRKMNDGMDVMFHENVDLEARDSQTDKNIVRYFELLGKNEIDKKKYPDLFFCNCNLGYRRDKYSGNMTRKILANDAAEIKSLIDIIEPENINTANPNPICASGTDLAIYEAAGKEKLLAERANIGKIARGDIAGDFALVGTLKMGAAGAALATVAAQEALTGVSFMVILAILNSFGVIAFAGVGIAEKICALMFLVPGAVMSAVSFSVDCVIYYERKRKKA